MDKKAEERLKRITKDAIEKCKECNIPIDEKATVKINTRAKKRYGVCRKRNSKFIIEISYFLFESTDQKIEQTVLHEFLHTCPVCFNHGRVWNNHAYTINKKYGFNIDRTNSREDMGLEAFTNDDYKYILKCSNPECKNTIKRMKMSKTIKYYTRYRCGACGCSFIKVKG